MDKKLIDKLLTIVSACLLLAAAIFIYLCFFQPKKIAYI